MIVLCGLLTIASGLTCGNFKCRSSSIVFPDDSYCVHTISNTYYVDPCSSSPYSCQIAYPYNETKCTYLQTYAAYSRYPGESCYYNSDCYYSTTCVSGVCVGISAGSPCTTTRSCEVGYYCSSQNTCQPQLLAGSSGCLNDYSCVNTAGCQLISNTNSTLNKCVKYFSLPNMSPSLNVNGLVCQSGFSNGTYCLEAPVSKSVPNMCTSSANCTSKTGQYTGYCYCGYNGQGNSYCSLFAGDSIALKAIQYTVKWLSSSAVLKAHSYNRLRYAYIRENWDKKDAYSFEYYNTYYTNFPLYYEAEDCALEVFGNNFYKAKAYLNSDDSDSFAYMTLAVSFLAYLV